MHFDIKSMLFLQRALSFRYWQHNFQRKDFAVLADSDLSFFRSFLPSHAVVDDPSVLEPYNLCFRKLDQGHSKLMLSPANTDHVSKILAHCNARKLAVVPQGGNTGLVGGSVPVFDEIILNLKNMNKIEGFSEVSSIVNCEAGVILQKLNQYLQPYGFETPLDLGSKGSCQIGGNAATNAGGKYVIKYGSFRSKILGLEAVMPNGDVLDLRSEIHKDNTGYDLKQLFIGGEGTLGVITKLNIACEKIDNIRKIMVFKTDKFEQILQSIPIIKRRLGKDLAALEYIDGPTYHTVVRHLHPGIFDKVQNNEHLLFVQASTEQLDELFQQMKDFNDAIVSNNDKEYSKIWKIREDVAVAAVREKGRVLAYDISFDVREWPGLLEHLRKETKSLVLGYGHIGDGNLHVNIILDEGTAFQDSFVFKEVTKHKGSISAQHGVGLHKPSYLSMQKSPQILQIYRSIKRLFDPNGIMNPHKVIPE